MAEQSSTEVYDEHFAAAMARTVAGLGERIDTCHERRPCPTCGAALGERCHSLARCSTARPHKIKYPHRDRWTTEVPIR